MDEEWHPFTHPVLLGNVDDHQELSWWAQAQHKGEWHPFAYPVELPDRPRTSHHQKQKANIRRWRRTSRRILRMTPKALRPLVAEQLLARTPEFSSGFILAASIPWVSTEEEVRTGTAMRSSGESPQWPPGAGGGPGISAFFRQTFKPYVAVAMEYGQPRQPAGHFNLGQAGDRLLNLVVGMQDA